MTMIYTIICLTAGPKIEVTLNSTLNISDIAHSAISSSNVPLLYISLKESSQTISEKLVPPKAGFLIKYETTSCLNKSAEQYIPILFKCYAMVLNSQFPASD